MPTLFFSKQRLYLLNFLIEGDTVGTKSAGNSKYSFRIAVNSIERVKIGISINSDLWLNRYLQRKFTLFGTRGMGLNYN